MKEGLAVLMILSAVMALGAWTLYERSVEAQAPVEIHADETLCNAKYANWIIRHEELAKPQPEQWHAFKAHMGKECVR